MKTIRIGIVGTENSHAHSFTEFFNKPDENGNYRYPGYRVTMVYGHYPESNDYVCGLGADKVADSLQEMVENVDAVMITARDGKFHYEFAKPFIEAGIPAFIDKPFTVDTKEALELIRLAKEKNVPLCGGSVLKKVGDIQKLKKYAQENETEVRGANLSAPIDMINPYSGFFFYASHLVEMTMEIFGYFPKSVIAVENNNNVSALIDYDTICVTNNFNNKCYNSYYGSIHGLNGSECIKVDISDGFINECDEFVEMLQNGKMSYSYEELAAPVFVMNAIKESYETGKRVYVKYE